MKITTKYGTYRNCSIQFNRHPNKFWTITILDEFYHPLFNVTKIIPELKLKPSQVLVKNYSENAGILKELIKHNILLDTGATVDTGFVSLHLCELLVDPKTYMEKNNG